MARLSGVVETEPRLGPREERLLRLADVLPGDGVVEAETRIGTFWLHGHDTVTTPSMTATGAWEPHLTAFLEETLEPGMTFVDIGAHIGWFSVLASRVVGPSGSVIAVEPEPGTIPLLKANLWRNRCANAVVLPLAAYEHTGHLALVVSDENRAGSGVLPPSYRGQTMVACARLDDLLPGRKIDVVKVDAEGTDHIALRGMEQVLRAGRGTTAVVEFWPKVESLGGDAPVDVLDYYSRFGFELSVLTEDGQARPVTPQEIMDTGSEAELLTLILRYRDSSMQEHG